MLLAKFRKYLTDYILRDINEMIIEFSHSDDYTSAGGNGESENTIPAGDACIEETEKYAHVIFFNGGVEEPNKKENCVLVKSPKVAIYDLKLEMSACEVCDKLVKAIKSGKYDVVISFVIWIWRDMLV